MASELHPLRFEQQIWLSCSQSLIFADSNRKFCKVSFPVLRTFLIFLNAFIFQWKRTKPVGYTRTLYSQTGENTKRAEIVVWCLLLIFKVVSWDHLTQLLPFAWDFIAKKGSVWSGTKWVNPSTFSWQTTVRMMMMMMTTITAEMNTRPVTVTYTNNVRYKTRLL